MATVSRTLNQPDSVKKETRDLVLNAVDALHYSPNFLGRNLRQLHTKRILVVLSNISNQFYSRVVKGIEDKAKEHDYHVLIFTTRDMKNNLLEAITMLQSKVVDGAIFMTTHQAEQQISELNKNYPIVCACEPVANSSIPCVAIDNIKASYDATRYLLKCGKRRIALLGINPNLLDNTFDGIQVGSAVLRETGYRNALKEFDIPFDQTLVIEEGLTYKAGIRCVDRLLKLPQLPDAVFALSDASAIGTIYALSKNGIRVPEDISVVGFDNTAMSEMYLPSVTTIGQPQYEIGINAMQLLLHRIHGEPAVSITVNHELILRDSVCTSPLSLNGNPLK